MVPMLTCGLVRSNFAFATGVLLWTSWFAVRCRWPRHRTMLAWVWRPESLSPADTANPPKAAPCGTTRVLLPGGLRDDFLRHVLRNLGVGVELHRVARPALSLRPQVADVAEHLGQRHESLDDAGTAALFHRLDRAAARVEVSD